MISLRVQSCLKALASVGTIAGAALAGGCFADSTSSDEPRAEAAVETTDALEAASSVWQIVSRPDARPSGRMAEFSSYSIQLVNIEPYLEGRMGRFDDPAPAVPMALSYLPPAEDASPMQLFTGFYPSIPVDGAYRRSDWLYWTTQPSTQILVRTSFRRRNDGKNQGWGLVGATMDFNVGGHGAGFPSSRVCLGALNLSNAQRMPCTDATAANDSGPPGHPVTRRHMEIPVYEYSHAPDFWSFITREFPSVKTGNEAEYGGRKIRYLAHLPVAVAGGVRKSAGFVFNTPNDNGFNGVSGWFTPALSSSCSQSSPARHYMRSRVWAVDNVPYRDDTRGGIGDVATNGKKLRVMFFAVEHLPVGDVPSNYFTSKVVGLGGTDRTEVYWFAEDPDHPGVSLPLGAMNRIDYKCRDRMSAMGPTGIDGSWCAGEYTSTIDNPDPVIVGACGDGICGKNERRATACTVSQDCLAGSSCTGGRCTGGLVCAADCKEDVFSNHFYHRRPEQAIWKGAIEGPADVYHQLPYGGSCDL